jgi:hypothetical protein
MPSCRDELGSHSVGCAVALDRRLRPGIAHAALVALAARYLLGAALAALAGRRLHGAMLVALTALCLPCAALAQALGPQGSIVPKHYVCYRTSGALTVDGKLDEASWIRAPWTEYFVDIQGDLKPGPRFQTRAKMLWDDEFFYIGADMEEPHLWATVAERDVPVYNEHDFEVFIDPDGDTHQYYELEMNALNTVWDLMSLAPHRDGGPMVNAWDIAGLETAVHLRGTLNLNSDVDGGWSAELALPWRVLRECAHRAAPPASGDQWRVNFSRVEQHFDKVGQGYRKQAAPEDNWVWSPQGLIAMHYPEMWGFVQFSTRVAGTEEEAFEPRTQDEAKAILCQIYYRQKLFHQKHGVYSRSLAELEIGPPALSHYRWPPTLQTTTSMFEAYIEERQDTDRDGRLLRWHIRQDSKIWQSAVRSGR